MTTLPNTFNFPAMNKFLDECEELLRRGHTRHDLSADEYTTLQGLYHKLSSPLAELAAVYFKSQDSGLPPDQELVKLYRRLAGFVASVGLIAKEAEAGQRMNVLNTQIAERGSHYES
jgi:hypothetical protein